MRARTSPASALSVGRSLSALSSLSFLYLFLFFRKGLRKTLSLLSCFLFCLFSLLSLCFASLSISAVSLFLSISRKRYVISLSERYWFARESRQPPITRTVLAIIRLPSSLIHNACNLSHGSDKSQYPKFTALYKIQNHYNCFAISRTGLRQHTQNLSFDNISYAVYIEHDYFNPVYLAQGWMKYGAAFKNLPKAFPETVF